VVLDFYEEPLVPVLEIKVAKFDSDSRTQIGFELNSNSYKSDTEKTNYSQLGCKYMKRKNKKTKKTSLFISLLYFEGSPISDKIPKQIPSKLDLGYMRKYIRILK
jgi:hypothetical protein